MTALTDLLFDALPDVLYLGSFQQDPARVTDPVTVENIAPQYSRPEVAWTRSGRDLVMPEASLFSAIPAGTLIVALGLWDSDRNGSLRFSWLIPVTHFVKGGTLNVPTLTLTLPE